MNNKYREFVIGLWTMLSIRLYYYVIVKLIVIMYYKILLGVCMIEMKFEFSFVKYYYVF